MNSLTIRNAKLIFRNFAGKETDFNPEGRRNFNVVIDDEAFASQLMADGWYLRPLKKRDEDEPQKYCLKVNVFFGKYPPTVIMMCGNNKVALDESTINQLDVADILNVNLTIYPRFYKNRGREGITAYLQTMVITIREDELLAEIGYNPYNSDEEEMPF